MKKVLVTAVAAAVMLAAPALVAQEHGSAGHANEAATGARDTGTHASTPEGHAKEAVEHGEGGQEHAMPNEIWWKWANFAILAIGLGWLISKNAGPYFAARGRAIQQGIEDAARMKAEADQRAAEMEARLSNLQREVESLKGEARQEIASEAARLQAESEEQLRKVQAHAEGEIAAASKTASQKLKAQAAELAVSIAEGQLRARVGVPEQNAFVQAFAEGLERQDAKRKETLN